jgi:hypothetical protein
VVWSWAPGQIFLCSRTWRGASSFQHRLYIDKQVGKTQGINSILYKEYESVLFIIIVISYLVLFFWVFSSACRHIPQLFYRNSCWDSSQPFCCFSILLAVAVYYRYSIPPLFPAHCLILLLFPNSTIFVKFEKIRPKLKYQIGI